MNEKKQNLFEFYYTFMDKTIMDFFLTKEFKNEFPFSPNYIDLKEGKMHFIDIGNGDPLLFLHGNPTWSFLYRHFILPLSDNNRVITIDHLGFGRSDKPFEAPYTVSWHIKNLTEMVLKLNLYNITLIVHNWGGPIGFGFAVENFERIKRLVVLNSWAFGIIKGARLHPALETIQKQGFGERLILKENFLVEQGIPAGIYKKEIITPLIMNAYRAPFVGLNYRKAMLALLRDIPTTDDHMSTKIFLSIEDRLHLLDVPITIIWGTQDPVFPPFLVNKWKYYFPSANVHLLSNASHFLQEDEPKKILSIIKEFISNT